MASEWAGLEYVKKGVREVGAQSRLNSRTEQESRAGAAYALSQARQHSEQRGRSGAGAGGTCSALYLQRISIDCRSGGDCPRRWRTHNR